ncbi:uncharacterized protein LOC118490677 [Helianthus annuus]|uniref:uncharacterized protein LOC118490677 n=1 Tax=Helianthus annuus TaxID=4232 RepID=UPI001652BED8|nr:uncharacterized protein LOC118490677 [Helianthus annuus]
MYRKNYRSYDESQEETTFYVTNLPCGISNSLLRKAFQPYGVVKDAYVARKKDVRGNNFGFIRYVGVTNINMVLEGMNSVKIFEAKVSASLAKFDKNHNKIERKFPDTRYVQPKPTPANPAPPVKETRHYATAGVPKRSLYRDILVGKQGETSGNSKRVMVEDRLALYPNHFMMRAVVVEVKSVVALEELRTLLDIGGYMDNPVSYLGGLKCMVVFKEKRLAIEFIEKESEAWSSVISSAVLWKGQDISYDRLVWLNIVGVPIQLRDNKLYDQIGEQFGRLAGGSQFSWSSSDNSSGNCWVVTEVGKRIDEEVKLLWREREYKAWVTEERNQDLQSVIAELTTSKFSTPAKSSGSVAGQNEEVEEGEIPVGHDETPARAGVDSRTPFEIPGENERSRREDSVHEEHAREGERLLRSVEVGSVNKVGHTTTKDLGSTRVSRKRPRSFISPHQLSPKNLFGAGDNYEGGARDESLDLNNPLVSTGQNSTDTNSETEIKETPAMDIDSEHITVLAVAEANNEAAQDIDFQTRNSGQLKNGDEDTRAETVATIGVGEKVGFQLSGFRDQVSKTIIGEGDQIVHQ